MVKETLRHSAPASVQVLGIQVHPVTRAELHHYLEHRIRARLRSRVLNVNVHCLNLAWKLPWLRELLNTSELVFCDGAGVILGAKLLGLHIPERITYADWMWELSAFCEEKGFSLYFVGARPGVAEKAAAKLRARFPRLDIRGCRDGFFANTGPENDAVVDAINRAAADILVLGMGMPRQEQWLQANWDRLNTVVALTGGACFDFVSETVPRCPRFMADHGMEWLYRLYVEPRRMFRRYIAGNPLFLARVLRARLLGLAKRAL